MRMPNIILNIECSNVLLPFGVEEAPEYISNEFLIDWLFYSNIEAHRLFCFGPVTYDQKLWIKSSRIANLQYNDTIYNINRFVVYNITSYGKNPLSVRYIRKIFDRKTDEYINFHISIDGLIRERR